ncbi:MAG: flagellar basal body-associated FliL family protein [Alphaproteobacteria bacterium]|nr:flagellar basal body-associated FliL family protein [Alphaproteobacteria bacterium]
MSEAEETENKEPAEGGEEALGEGGDSTESGGGRFNAKKIILFAVLPLFVLGGLGAGAYFMGFLDGLLPGQVECAEGEKGENCKEAAVNADALAPGFFIDVPNLIVNLNATSKNPHFLKISLKVELEKAEDEAGFNEILPRVIDQFQTYLRELRMEDLRGSAGLYRMKIELLNRVRAAAPHIKIKDVLFQEILVQ